MIRERTPPLKGRGFQLVYIARRHHAITEGESEVKGVFGMGDREGKWEAMPHSIPGDLMCHLPSAEKMLGVPS